MDGPSSTTSGIGLQRPGWRLGAVRLRGHPGDLALEASRGAHEQIPRRGIAAVDEDGDEEWPLCWDCLALTHVES